MLICQTPENRTKKDEIVMRDSAQAAQAVSVKMTSDDGKVTEFSGWLSRGGYLFEDERGARYHGCTHCKCERCGNVYLKNSYCERCSDKRQRKAWLEKPIVEWDGETFLYSVACQEYFSERCEIVEYLAESDNRIEEFAAHDNVVVVDLMLVLCKPVEYHTVDAYDIYDGDIPEDGDVDDEILQAFDELNAKIAAHKRPICWVPGEQRVIEI